MQANWFLLSFFYSRCPIEKDACDKYFSERLAKSCVQHFFAMKETDKKSLVKQKLKLNGSKVFCLQRKGFYTKPLLQLKKVFARRKQLVLAKIKTVDGGN